MCTHLFRPLFYVLVQNSATAAQSQFDVLPVENIRLPARHRVTTT